MTAPVNPTAFAFTQSDAIKPSDVSDEKVESGSYSPTKGSGEHGFEPPAKIPFHRSVFFNLTVLGLCSFCAPGIWGAMTSLGAGGEEKPFLVNAANALTFSLMVLTCAVTPVMVRFIGIKGALIFGTMGYAPYAAGLYTNDRFGTQWFVLFGAALCGISAGVFWSAEGAIAISYPMRRNRAFYIAWWLSFRVSGQILGGAINLGLNAHNDARGAVSYHVYQVFIALQCLGPVIALLLAPPHRLLRRDGSPVSLGISNSVSVELYAMWKMITKKHVVMLIPMFVFAAYSEAFNGTFLTDYFTVRSRALGSFLSAWTCIIANFILSAFLDSTRFSLKFRARAGFIFVYTLAGALWAWSTYIQHEFSQTHPLLDWSTPGFGRGFGLYIMIATQFQLAYSFAYWVVGTMFTYHSDVIRIAGVVRGVESAGQAVSYGINSTHWTLQGSSAINYAVWGVAVIPAWFVVRLLGTSVYPGPEILQADGEEGRPEVLLIEREREEKGGFDEKKRSST